MSNYGGGSLLNFPLSATGNVPPSVTTSSNAGSLDAPSGAVFNGAGDLWVSTSTSIAEFTPSQLASSGDPAPAVVIQNGNDPSGVAFDSAGDLWVSSSVEVSPSTRPAS